MGGGPAIADDLGSQGDLVLTQFREVLAERAAANPAGESDLEAFDALTADQRMDLADYFLGESETVEPTPNAEQSIAPDGSMTYTDGDLSWGESALVPRQTMAATTSRSVWGTQWFAFAGIKITETKVSGTFTTSGGKASAISSYACTVVQNLDPMTQVKAAKNAAYVSGGKAYFKCKVTVKRGAPTPWGQVTWSTREAIQYVRAGGSGVVEANGWE
jgi:hypothetical protein